MNGGDVEGDGLANSCNAEGKQPVSQRRPARAIQGRQHPLGMLLTEDPGGLGRTQVQPGEAIEIEAEKIQWRCDQAALDQLVGHDASQFLNIQCSA